MKPSIVFSDIDGTLIHDDGVSTVKSLSVRFSLISTRLPQAIAAYREQLKPRAGVHKLLCMGEPEFLNTAEKELEQKLEGVLVNRAGKHHLEFSHLEAVKVEAVRKICRRLGLKLEQAMAFGDSGWACCAPADTVI